MNLFNKLPGFRRTPAGAERLVLRRIPRTLLAGSLLLAAPSLLGRLVALLQGNPSDVAATIRMIDYVAVGALTLFWAATLTVAIAAAIVLVMKGPGYVADPYPVPDSEAPATPRRP